MRIIKNFFSELKNTAKNIKFLLSPLWKYGKTYFVTTMILQSIFINPIITLIQISTIKLIINAFVQNKSFLETISIPLFLESIALILKVIELLYSELYANKKILDINNSINMELFNKIIHTDYINFDDPEFFDSYSFTSRYYTSTVMDAFNWLINIIQSIVTITFLFVSASLTASLNNIPIFFIVVIAIVVSTAISKKSTYYREEQTKKHIPFNRMRFYADNLFAIKEFAMEQKCTRLSEFAMELHENAISKKKELINEYKVKNIKYQSLAEIINFLFNLSINFYLIYMVVSDKILFGDFAGLLAVANSFRRNIGVFFGSYIKAHEFNLHCEQVHTFFDKESVIENNKGKYEIPAGAFGVEFKDVCFSYKHSNFSINNFCLKINKGEKIAIVGENGAGKTTITKLLMRLYDPSSGQIFVNDKLIEEYNTRLLRLKIGTAFQNTHIYTMSYKKNISLYHDMNTQEIDEVSKKLKLDNVLKKNNADYFSQVGREFDGSGIIMSVGEAQKMGVARVLSGDFGLLIFDEPTSSLDPIAEDELNKIIFDKANTTTTILISHRLSTVCEADRIILIENGNIVEEGNHTMLMSKHGKYYEMFTKQAKKYRV